MTDASFIEALVVVGDELLVDQRLPDGWAARYHFAPTETGLQLTRIEVTPGDASSTISTAGIRAIRPVEAARRALRQARNSPGVLRIVDHVQQVDRWERLALPAQDRASMDESRLAGVALEYVRAIDMGERAPAATVASLLGVRPVQARGYLRRARALGLLTEARHGSAGGVLTEKAIELLAPNLKPGQEED